VWEGDLNLVAADWKIYAVSSAGRGKGAFAGGSFGIVFFYFQYRK